MSFKSITTASSLSTAEINQLLDIASEMKRIVNSRVKRGPQLLGKSLAVLDFEGDLLAANTLKLACEYMSGISFCFSDCKNVGESVARARALGANFVALLNSDGKSVKQAAEGGAQIIDCGSDASAVKILTYLFTLKDTLETVKSLDVTVLGDAGDGIFVGELSSTLARYESKVSVFASGEQTFLKEKGCRVYNDIGIAVSGCDAVIDCGLKYDGEQKKFYGHPAGLTEELLKSAQTNAPLFDCEKVFSKEKGEWTVYAHSVLTERIKNRLAVCMAALYLMSRN